MAGRTDLQEAMYTTSRPDVIGMIAGRPRRSLDIGCSDGSVSAQLRDEGTETWGIEIDAGFARAAATRLDQVLEGDALERTADLVEDGDRFDLVICADSLEHMAWPDRVLDNVRRLATDDAQVIVSLPNVRFYTTLTNLILRGRWQVRDRGVHDATHLRWFTDRNAREMFEACGFRVEDHCFNYRLIDSPRPQVNRWARHLARGPLEGYLVYQMLYRLRPA